jgi:hypothetical protein
MAILRGLLSTVLRRDPTKKDRRPAWVVEASAIRDGMKARYLGLFDDAAALFFHVDPAGINFEVNIDEYEGVVGTVLPGLEDCASEVDARRRLYREFDRWFGNAYESSRVDRLASELWPLWVAWTAERERKRLMAPSG